ncbi:integrase [Vibrio cyclitrophicus]
MRSIIDCNKKVINLGKEELETLISQAISNGNFTSLEQITNVYTGIYSALKDKPWWLVSDFEDDIWIFDFQSDTQKKIAKSKQKISEIDWTSIILDDGKPITSNKHRQLLNAFKYWLIAVDNPFDNGGNFITATTARAKFNRVVSMINSILINAHKKELANNHLQKFNDDFWLSILTSISARGNVLGIYGIEPRIKNLLDNAANTISDEDAEAFSKEYPYLLEELSEDKNKLLLNDRVKSCKWLFNNGFYKQSNGGIRYTGNSAFFASSLFEGKVLDINKLNIPVYPEIVIIPPVLKTEYPRIDSKDYSKGITKPAIENYIQVIRLIHTNIGRTDAAQPNIIGKKVLAINVMQNEQTIEKTPNRTKTVPPEVIFNLLRDCYEFTKEHLPVEPTSPYETTTLLSEVLKLLETGNSKSTKADTSPTRPKLNSKEFNESLHRELPSTERAWWFEYEAINTLSTEYIKKGIKQIIPLGIDELDKHKKIQSGESLFNLFSVLQGSIQILVGATVARRQDELIELEEHGNLVPNINPFTEKGGNTQYDLKFKVKKTGVGGKKGQKELAKRPIPRSIAKMIWQLEQFNIGMNKRGLSYGTLSLFNTLDPTIGKIGCVDHKSYNTNLDNACDYHETLLVKYSTVELRRLYVRQHQLRRFFAMAFFWSKRFKGMDSLRWMLAHSDVQHLYNYISELESGAVLLGVKATAITRSLIDPSSELYDTESIEILRKTIANRILGNNSRSIDVSSLSEAYDCFKDESYHTIPSIDQIETEQMIEYEVLNMLKDGSITLEPDFFSISDASGKKIQTFTLILKTKDLD